jgi:3-deoxy-7-phosphoheptulonate synthase
MLRAAVAAGADGLILEVHPNPDHALSDGAQSLNLQNFAATMPKVARVAEAIGRRARTPELAGSAAGQAG